MIPFFAESGFFAFQNKSVAVPTNTIFNFISNNFTKYIMTSIIFWSD